MVRIRYSASVLAAFLAMIGSVSARADISQTAKVQAALAKWVTDRAPIEHVTGATAYVSFGSAPPIEAFAGRVGNGAHDALVGRSTLFQMGSTSKSFTAAIILKLEAAGKLSIDDGLGKFLPQYPVWKDVSIRRLLNMTSGIPTYSETEALSRMWVSDPTHDASAEDLVKLVYPTGGTADLPATTGYHYSNTNYILAGMIAAKVAGRSYRDLVHDMVIDAFGLSGTFYEDGTYPAAVTRRLAHGYFVNPACTDQQPKCTKSWNLPLLGRDVRGMSTSWAQAAGGAVSDARDVDRWMRAVFDGRVVPPKQQAEWRALVSTKTGRPIADVSAGDPRGFSLGLAKSILGPIGAQWFYEGETLGYRTLYVWFPKENLMITVQTNSQPAADADKLHDVVDTIYRIVRVKAK